MDVPVILTYLDPAGAETHIPLNHSHTTTTLTYYLPDVATEPLSVSLVQRPGHASIRLDIEKDHCLLSVYEGQPKPIVILGDSRIAMPISTPSHQKSITLTESHQFLTSLGRWRVVWDRSSGISQSMHAPPPPADDPPTADEDVRHIDLYPLGVGGALLDHQDMRNLSTNEYYSPVPVANVVLPPAAVTASEEDSSDYSGKAERTELCAAKHEMATKPDNGGPQERASTVYAELESSTEGEEDDIETVSSSRPPPLPEVSSHIQQESTGLDLHPEEMVPREGIAHVSNKTDETINHHEEEPSTQTTAELETVSRLAEYSSRKLPNLENDTTNDNEVQHCAGRKKGKRRLSDIEHETDRTQHKRQKGANSEGKSSIKIANSTAREVEDTITVAVDSLTVSNDMEKQCSKNSAARGNKRRPTTVRKSVESKQKTKSLPNSTTATTTPMRRSARRRTTSSSASESDYQSPRIIFGSTSKLANDKNIMSTIEKLGGLIVADIKEADVLCIGNANLKKTSKFVIAVAKGKDIVTDDWLKQAHVDQKFPECQGFMPTDTKHETEWGFSLAEALERGKQGLQPLEGTHVYLTAQLRKDLGNLVKDLKLVGLALGAAGCHNGLPAKDTKFEVVVIGSVKNVDPECYKVKQLGHKLYSQDILTMAALRGQLEIDSNEFVISPPIKEEPSSQ